MESSSSEGICVAIRVRPLNGKELSSGQNIAFKCIPEYNAIVQQGRDGVPIDGQYFQYDKVFEGDATSKDVYSYIAKDIVSGVAKGINGTIFACM